MSEKRCDHDLIPEQCFDCRNRGPLEKYRDLLVYVVTTKPTAYHRDSHCNALNYYKAPSTTLRTIPFLEALAMGIRACETCRPVGVDIHFEDTFAV